MARLCKYNELVKDRLSTIKAWKRKGLTDKEIAVNLGINQTTLCDYKKKFPKLARVLKGGLSDAIAQVENSLFKCANGFSVDESVTVEITDDEGTVIVRTTKTKKVYPPNVAAMIFYLKNRVSQDWQDRRQVGLGDWQGKPLDNVHFLLPDNGMDDGDEKK